jgi:hypothetical protein
MASSSPRHYYWFARPLFFLAASVTGIWCAWVFEDLRGQRDWLQYQAGFNAKGEVLQALPLPVIPEKENFAKSALFNRRGPAADRYRKLMDLGRSPYEAGAPPLASWQRHTFTPLCSWAEKWWRATDQGNLTPASETAAATEILKVLEPFGQELATITQDSRMPYSRFSYDLKSTPSQSHLSILQKITPLFSVRASARLQLGQSAGAAQDVATALRLANSLQNEPDMVSFMTRLALLRYALQPLWEGFVRSSWTAPQERLFAFELARLDLPSEYLFAVRAERARSNQLLDGLVSGYYPLHTLDGWFEQTVGGQSTGWWNGFGLFPRGWLYRNQIALNEYYRIVGLEAVAQGQFQVALIENNSRLWHEEHTGSTWLLGRMLSSPISALQRRTANLTASVRQAQIVCALEAYHEAHGQYPADLAALAPKWIDEVPADPMSGKAFRYQADKKKYALYSIGWNLTDDGGSFVPEPDVPLLDWVWSYPEQIMREPSLTPAPEEKPVSLPDPSSLPVTPIEPSS